MQGEKGESENAKEGGKQGESKYVQDCERHLLMIDCHLFYYQKWWVNGIRRYYIFENI